METRFSWGQRIVGVVLKPASKKAVYAFIDALDLFGIGASWGGFESLIQPAYPERARTATRWQAEGPLVRIHIGLEDPQDLIADLAQGLDKLRNATA
jgi:cystathionine beta-lyase